MLFDKDEDGVLTFSELEVVMKCLGQRPSGWYLLYMNSKQRQCKTGKTMDILTKYPNIKITRSNWGCHYNAVGPCDSSDSLSPSIAFPILTIGD